MKKLLLAMMLTGCMTTSAFAALKEVVKEASGSGATQHQAISEALLVAVQSVNGTTVSQRVDYEETVNISVGRNHWSYSGKSSPIFSVDSTGSGSVTKFQVLSVSGSKGNYRAKVRAHVVQYESSVQDQHLRRVAVLPFQFVKGSSTAQFSSELADTLGNHLVQSGQLSLVDRHYLEEMQFESDFLMWDGAPHEMARLGQKVGADYLVVGRINSLAASNSSSMYGLNNGSEQIRLSWRVIEANTSKVVAAGNFNRNLPNNSIQNILNDQLDDSSADKVAQVLSNEILVGLKLQPAVSGGNSSTFTPTYEMTPGSSEKPVQW